MVISTILKFTQTWGNKRNFLPTMRLAWDTTTYQQSTPVLKPGDSVSIQAEKGVCIITDREGLEVTGDVTKVLHSALMLDGTTEVNLTLTNPVGAVNDISVSILSW